MIVKLGCVLDKNTKRLRELWDWAEWMNACVTDGDHGPRKLLLKRRKVGYTYSLVVMEK